MAGKIVIAGGSGLIGTELCRQLSTKGYKPVILSRHPAVKGEYQEYRWDPKNSYVDPEAMRDCYALINLAGANISEKRWTKKRKEELQRSRLESTKTLVAATNRSMQKPALFISASGSGYYGDRGEMMLDEQSGKGNGFLPDLCEKWEEAAQKAELRLVIFRIGIVLSDKGGFLVEVGKPVKWGIGAVLGSGEQYVPWIHVEDLARAFIHVIENNNCSGVYNACAPSPVNNREITKLIAAAMKRPLILPAVPEFFLRLVFGELSDALLMSNRCSAAKLQQSGFDFKFSDAATAINELLDHKH